ncbi:hypothetical protein, partial [Lacisediminimonas sp.]|uniref:hypothetical protein n=1 Tax=Lacisediminimonas sp. TaxID=3060582 RepID=UPI00271D7B2C
GLRQALYVQMQAAYDVVDQLGYQQAAAQMTTQLMAEVNTLSKLFDGSAWTAASLPDGSVNYDDAYAVTKGLLVSGLTPSDLGATDRIFYSGSTRFGTSQQDTTMNESTYNGLAEFSAYKGRIVNVMDDISGARIDTFFVDSRGDPHRPITPVLADTAVTSFDGITVPDTALPGDMLKSSKDGEYYLVNIKRQAVQFGSGGILSVVTMASAEKSEAWSEKLSAAISELSKNGQIEAARMQQLVNLLQLLIGGASNTESRETKAKESILSKF